MNLTVALIAIVHIIFNTVCVYGIGCYVFTSCFIYLASIRIIIFSFITEILLILSLFIIFNLDYLTLFSLKELALSQVYISNFFFLNYLFFIIFCGILLLDGMRLPFDYSECESELVAGIVTEFSGLFFILYSLSESNHCILNCIFLVTVVFGGIFFSYKLVLVLLFIILVPRSILCRFKITDVSSYLALY
jgi:NADH:ubiquinone oxidoreductase subunit H